MAKVARTPRTNNPPPVRRHRFHRIYTARRPVLFALPEHVLPGGFYQRISAFQLSREPLRIDVVVVRRSHPGTAPAPHLLVSIVGDLADHTLVHFKGPTDELERDDARMLFAYALQYLVVADIDDPVLVALRVVASRVTPRFVAALSTGPSKWAAIMWWPSRLWWHFVDEDGAMSLRGGEVPPRTRWTRIMVAHGSTYRGSEETERCLTICDIG